MQYKDAVERLLDRPRLLLLLLMTIGAGVYAGAFLGAFQYDDGFAILLNPHLDRVEVFVGHLDHMVRPVLHATFLLDRSLYGDDPAGYHLLNLLLHLGCGLLVYRILSRALAEDTRYVPLGTAVLFLVHPIQTEAVTYISGRATGLMAFFYLLAFLLYLQASESTGNGRIRPMLMSGATASLVLSLGSKETAMTFPLAVLLWDVLIRRLDSAALRKAIARYHLPFWLVVCAVAVWGAQHPRYGELARFSWELRPWTATVLSELHAAWYAAWLMICPWKQNFDHDLPVFHSAFQWPVPLELAGATGLAITAVITARRVPLVSFGIGWYILHLIPVSVIPRADLLSERNLYLPSIGFLLAFVSLISLMVDRMSVGLAWRRLSPIPGAVVLVIVVGLGFMTVQRNALYRDPVLLWSDTVRKSPNKARPHNNLGSAYGMRDDWDRAIQEYRTAAQLDPDYALARNNLRDAYLRQVGRP